MKSSSRVAMSMVGAWLVLATMSSVHAAPVILNGGFEAGFASWTRVDQLGSEGTFFVQSGTASPVNGDAVPAPPQGTNAAMTDAGGPGSHVLYQDFVATPAANATLSFAIFIGNRADRFATPAFLDFSTPALNQQARVDILATGADPFSVAAADILFTLFQTQVGDALVSGYNTITSDITALLAAHSGQTLRLRFAETDNLAPFQLGVDNVSINVVPEPALALLLGAGLAASLAARGATRARRRGLRAVSAIALFGSALCLPVATRADSIPTEMLDPNLQVTTVLNTGITQPIGIVFLGSANDYLVLEKASGQIKRVTGGVLQATPVLDLAVNSNSERGLLSMALHPNFPATPFAYVRWTESSTGANSTAVANVPLLGNRVDRFAWDGSAGVGSHTDPPALAPDGQRRRAAG